MRSLPAAHRLALGPDRRPSPTVEIVTAVVAGAVATKVKTVAESVLQPRAERLFAPTPAQQELMGADPSGHPGNMPPHIMLDKAAALVGADPLSDSARDLGSQVVHWATGIGAALTYGLLARRFPVVRAGRGVGFGVALLAGTHGSVLPAMGIQAPLADLPRSWWVWEPGSHLVFGVVLDAFLRAGDATARTARRNALGPR